MKSERVQIGFLTLFVLIQIFLLVWQIKPWVNFSELSLPEVNLSFRFSMLPLKLHQPAIGGTRFPPSQSYFQILQTLEKNQERKSRLYRRSGRAETKKRLVKESRAYLLNILSREIFPAWYGTPWAFSGQTDQPGRGAIACGIFVSTVLKQLGFSLDRIRLGIQPSRYIITNLVGAENISFLSGCSLQAIKTEILRQGKNLYIVGLDKHTGFIFYDGCQPPYFIHSSGQAGQVIKEPVENSETLKKSRYCILAPAFTDKMIENWLTKTYLSITTDYYQGRSLTKIRSRRGKKYG
ncbi:MAG: hypothetical protein NC911_08885 [Candidatus Omnitrophica bacterium]|nr:hypothetical protein [Candidatus Omnitrophota bacterium]